MRVPARGKGSSEETTDRTSPSWGCLTRLHFPGSIRCRPLSTTERKLNGAFQTNNGFTGNELLSNILSEDYVCGTIVLVQVRRLEYNVCDSTVLYCTSEYSSTPSWYVRPVCRNKFRVLSVPPPSGLVLGVPCVCVATVVYPTVVGIGILS